MYAHSAYTDPKSDSVMMVMFVLWSLMPQMIVILQNLKDLFSETLITAAVTIRFSQQNWLRNLCIDLTASY